MVLDLHNDEKDCILRLAAPLAEEFFERRIFHILEKLENEFKKIEGRPVPVYRFYSLASPMFSREEAYDVLKILREVGVLDFTLPHGITIKGVGFSKREERKATGQ